MAPEEQKSKSSAESHNELFRTAVESLPHAFYVIDAKTYTIVIANSATEIFGKRTDGATCYALTHHRDRPCNSDEHICPIMQVKQRKKPVQVEHIHYDKDGNARFYEVHAYPIFNQAGDVAQMIEYTLDITDRKNAEAALVRARDELEGRVRERTAELERLNNKLMDEIAEHQHTEFELLQHQQKLKSMASKLAVAEEQQRRQLATDLHDSIGQSLAALQMKLSEIRSRNDAALIQDELNHAFQLLEGIVQETRTLTFELSPPLLYDIGLEAAVEWLVENFQERYNLKILLKDDGAEKPLHEKGRQILFRIIRELLMNVVKHARAKNVAVFMSRQAENININITDDGVGFDPAERIDSFGLFSIRERLEYLGGSIDIQSSPGSGATVFISAPLFFSNRKNVKVV